VRIYRDDANNTKGNKGDRDEILDKSKDTACFMYYKTDFQYT